MRPHENTNLDIKARRGLAALRRAARKARKFAFATNTPFYIMKDGKIVNLTAMDKRKAQLAAGQTNKMNRK